MLVFYTVVDLLLFGVAVFFLVKSTTIIIHALNNLSRSSKVELFVLVGFFSAVATSLPELFVSVSSALAKAPHIALGLVIGSNIADITLVIGCVTLLGGSLSVAADFVKKDITKAFGAIVFPFVLLVDGWLSRIDGLLLLFTFCVYHLSVFRDKNRYSHALHGRPFIHIGSWLHHFDNQYQKKQIGWFLLGVIMLLFSADVIVQIGTRIASDAQVPLLLIGFFLVGVGTSLPELVFELRAIKNKQTSMVFGDLLGSLVANSTLILGLTAVIYPIHLVSETTSLLIASIGFVLGFFLLWILIRTKFKLVRWEGAVLVCFYVLFFLAEFSMAMMQ